MKETCIFFLFTPRHGDTYKEKKGITASLLIQAAATWHIKLEVVMNEYKNTREFLNRRALLQLK